MASTDLLEALRVARQDAEDAKVKLFFLKDLLLSSIIPSTATLRPGERLAQAGPILAAPSTAQPPAFRSWLAENGFIGKNRRSPGHAAVGELFETNADAAALMGEALGSLVADHLNLSLVQRRLEEEGFPEFPPPSVEDSARRATAPSVDSLPNISADALVQRLLAERKEAQRLKRAVQRADPSARIADDGHLYSWADAERYVNSLAEESAALREEKEVLSAECQRLSEELGRQRWKGPDAQSNEVAARNQAIGDWAWFDDRKYDFFISYRVESESFLAKELYFRLKLKEYPEKHDVFLDAEKLTDGEDWRDGFVQGLKSAKVIVLLVSRKAMERLKRSDSFVDNLLLEWETSLIASELGYCAVLPIFIEDALSSLNPSDYPSNRFALREDERQCFMSARDTVQLLRQRQGVTLLDRNRVAFLVDKICDKLEVFNRERGSNFRIAIDAARAPADVHASELVLSNLPAAVFENFLEHALSFYSNLAELRLRGMNFEAQTLQLMKKHVVAKKTLSLLEIKDSKFFETPSDHSLEDFFRAAANAKTISKLTLSNCGFTTIGVVKSITHNFPLKELDLSSNPFGVDASFKWFAEGPSLTRLVLSNTAITNASMESLQTFVVTVATNLHMLDISKNRLTAASARQIALILANHRALRELDLHDNALGEQGGVEIAAALATNSTLKSLSLKSTGIQKTSALALASALGTNSTLASLNLLKSSIMTGGAIAILLSRAVEAGTLSNLEIDGTFLAEGFHRKTKELVLAGRNLHEDSILPKVLPSLKELERLVLKGTRIGESPETLALYTSHLNDFALLAHLDFSFCRISIVDGLADALKSNTTLKGLNLRGNEIDDASFEILAEAVKSNTCLIVLDLRDNYMGDSSAPFVEDLMLRNARIELLLSASKFEDQSVLRGMARVNLFNEGDDPSVVSGKAEDYT